MHIKVKNFQDMWEKEGYLLKGYDEVSQGKTLVELEVLVGRQDGKSIKFYEEWDVFKGLATRQSFYVMPIMTFDNGTAGLLLVAKDRIHPVVNQFTPVRMGLEESYWWLQKDEEVLDLRETTHLLKCAVSKTRSDLNYLKSVSETSFLAKRFRDQNILDGWETYKALVLAWSTKVNISNKISNEVKNNAQLIAELYRY